MPPSCSDEVGRPNLVIAAANSRLTLDGLCSLLRGLDVAVIDEDSPDFERLRLQVEQHRPDALIARVPLRNVPDMTDLLKLRQIHPRLALVLITISQVELERLPMKLSTSEGLAFLTSHTQGAFLSKVLSLACQGFTILAPEISHALAPMLSRQTSWPRIHLRPREKDILERVAQGVPDAEIANQLGVSVRSIQQGLADARAKLGAVDRCHAVAIAVRGGLI